MQVDLVGIVENGAVPDPALPQSAAQPIRAAKGQTVSVRIQVLTRSGQPVDLSGVGTTLTLTLKRKSSDQVYVTRVALTPTDAGNGMAAGTVLGAATVPREFGAGLYVYDVWLSRAGQYDEVVPLSAWFMLPSAQ